MATWNEVSAAVAALPESEEGTSRGLRIWRIRKKLLAWERPLRVAERKDLGSDAPEGPIVGLPAVDVFEKEELIAAAPEIFFTTPHFEGHASVLARLEMLPVDVLVGIVRSAWLRSAPKGLVRDFESAVGES